MTDTNSIPKSATDESFPAWDVGLTYNQTIAETSDSQQSMQLNIGEVLFSAAVRLDQISAGLIPPNLKLEATLGVLSVHNLEYSGSIDTDVGPFTLDVGTSSREPRSLIAGVRSSLNILPYYLPNGFDLWGVGVDVNVGVRATVLDEEMAVDHFSLQTPYVRDPLQLTPAEIDDFFKDPQLGVILFNTDVDIHRHIFRTDDFSLGGTFHLGAEFINMSVDYGLSENGLDQLASIYDYAKPETDLALSPAGEINFSDWLFSFGPELDATLFGRFRLSAGLDVLVNDRGNEYKKEEISKQPVLRPHCSISVLLD